MGWIKRQKDQHVCPKPELDEVDEVYPGDVWQCDSEDCERQWIVKDHQIYGLYWFGPTVR